MEYQTTTTRQVPWADLPSGLVSLIASKYTSDAAEYVSLRRVCRHWCRSLTDDSPLPPLPSPQLPFLLVPPCAIYPRQAMPQLGKIFRIPFLDPFHVRRLVDDLPQLENTEGSICVGSSHGWLITLDRASSISLLNPVTADVLRLEPLSKINDTILSFNPDSFPEYHLMEKGISHSQFSIVHRAVLSSDPAKDSDFTLLLFLSGLTDCCFTLCGKSRTWSQHKHRPLLVEDVVLVNGVFIAIDRLANLVFFDFRNHKHEPVITWYCNVITVPFGDVFLVNSDGHLLIVSTNPLNCQNQFVIPRNYISVFEYPLNHEPRIKARKIREFRDLVLFLGHGCSVSVPVQHFTCLVDTVYFARVYVELEMVEEEGVGRMTVLYQGAVYQNYISDRSKTSESVRVYDVDNSQNSDHWTAPRPFWVTPNINRIY